MSAGDDPARLQGHERLARRRRTDSAGASPASGPSVAAARGMARAVAGARVAALVRDDKSTQTFAKFDTADCNEK
ncbi:hypothetical protein C7S16_5526 [Burkholderia thailandensis]|uniref:Uncharacterized protein n=1 Tax=Burkholderia thailandensis TaxID=57975 RepID=A0AAW9CR16_BURTH|nr:hypothetical protein [Burkholderia thailandensis]MDW9253034.1 hypothetical protein [Burkholderia thailandensis]